MTTAEMPLLPEELHTCFVKQKKRVCKPTRIWRQNKVKVVKDLEEGIVPRAIAKRRGLSYNFVLSIRKSEGIVKGQCPRVTEAERAGIIDALRKHPNPKIVARAANRSVDVVTKIANENKIELILLSEAEYEMVVSAFLCQKIDVRLSKIGFKKSVYEKVARREGLGSLENARVLARKGESRAVMLEHRRKNQCLNNLPLLEEDDNETDVTQEYFASAQKAAGACREIASRKRRARPRIRPDIPAETKRVNSEAALACS